MSFSLGGKREVLFGNEGFGLFVGKRIMNNYVWLGVIDYMRCRSLYK